MKKCLFLLVLGSSLIAGLPSAKALGSLAVKRAEPTLEQRVADLEAYVNNGRAGLTTPTTSAPN
jgi:hypothetical protein